MKKVVFSIIAVMALAVSIAGADLHQDAVIQDPWGTNSVSMVG
ncbi:MAG TPA: hypothetical protein VFV52_13910 [Bacilli bacterium]|nr:hypothetical protein [Bacilli bacterium]